MADSTKPPDVNVTVINKGCGSGCGTGCASIIVLLIVASAITTWIKKDKTDSSNQPTNTPPITNRTNPTPTPRLATPAPFVPTPVPRRFATAPEAQQEAIRLYPALGIAGSEFNRAFLARHKQYQEQQPDFLRDPNWPITLAHEVASTLKSK